MKLNAVNDNDDDTRVCFCKLLGCWLFTLLYDDDLILSIILFITLPYPLILPAGIGWRGTTLTIDNFVSS